MQEEDEACRAVRFCGGVRTLILREKQEAGSSAKVGFRICIIIIRHLIYKSTMGLGSGSKCIYKSKSLTQDQLRRLQAHL
jgi:hypothetical protein